MNSSTKSDASTKLMREVLNEGYGRSIRTTIKIAPQLGSYLGAKNIRTVRELVLLSKVQLQDILSHSKNHEGDLVLIEEALDDVGLNLGMTETELLNYKYT